MTPSNPPYDPDSEATAELLRQALSAEAAEVQPDPDALRSIQQRTAAVPSPLSDSSDPARRFYAGSTRTNLNGRRSWMLGAVGAAAATAAVITAVVVVGDQGADPSRTPAASPDTTAGQTDVTTEPTVDAPTPTTQPSATTQPSVTNAPAGEQVTIYYVGPTPSNPRLAPRLYPELHTVSLNGDSRAVAAVREFFTLAPLDPDYSSGWPTGVEVKSISERRNGMTIISLDDTGAFLASPSGRVDIDDELLWAVRALLATAGVEDQAMLRFDNNARVGPFARPTDYDARALVSITAPVEGQTVDSPVTVEGTANVYEGNLNWELLDVDGQVIDSGHTMAGAYEWAPFTIELGSLDPGTYTIRAFESSAKDGSLTFIDDKTFSVR